MKHSGGNKNLLELLLAEPNLSDRLTGVSTAVSSLACFDDKINVNLKIKSSFIAIYRVYKT